METVLYVGLSAEILGPLGEDPTEAVRTCRPRLSISAVSCPLSEALHDAGPFFVKERQFVTGSEAGSCCICEERRVSSMEAYTYRNPRQKNASLS